MQWLAYRPLVDLLYRLAERSGMSWWKNRWKQATEQLRDLGTDPDLVERVADDLGRDDPAVAPPGEGRDLPFEDFRKAFGSEIAAARWVRWAEHRRLLVRGSKITCPFCDSPSWLPMASLPPPVACAGCGRQIGQPYGPRNLNFTYRIGEGMRRVLETDSLGHLFALHWLSRLFDSGGLVGVHPGVEFTSDGSNSPLGEADVLLLFRDGSMVPVEVKRRATGVDNRAIQLMDTLADALSTPYDVLAVTQPARECDDLQRHGKALPERPRLLLTTDQLYQDFVVWMMGANPFEWSPLDEVADRQREKAFARRLGEYDPENVRDLVSEALLDRSID